jgi:acetolactate synthase-1/2/3 large subunit
MFEASSRPLILFGAGVRSSGSHRLAHDLVDALNVPYVLSWGAKDLFEDKHPLNCGSHGVYGSRAANLAVQNCDFMLILGSRLDTRQTGGSLPCFAPSAKKVMVDLDSEEIGKLVEKGCKIDLPIITELNGFLEVMHSKANESFEPPSKSFSTWLQRTQEWKSKYANADVDKERKYELESTEPDVMNVYSFLETLGEKIPANSTVVPDQGGNLCWTMQTLKVRDNWRLYTNLGNSSMGFAFPCCIGSALGTSNPVICIDGDGGFQMNIQELKTAVDYNLPIKTFILNNSGYGIIKQFQDAYFDKRYIVTNFNPVDFVSIAKGYGMYALRIISETDVDEVLTSVFEHPGPVLVDVSIQQYQKIFPKLEFGNALEHMTPFIPIDELKATMIADMTARQEPKGWVQAKF